MMNSGTQKRAFGPLAVAMTVAAFGLLALLVVNHGPWHRPHIQSEESLPNTAAAAQAAGATVTPAEPKSMIEPASPGPKRANR
jgi:hypothetical protein